MRKLQLFVFVAALASGGCGSTLDTPASHPASPRAARAPAPSRDAVLLDPSATVAQVSPPPSGATDGSAHGHAGHGAMAADGSADAGPSEPADAGSRDPAAPAAPAPHRQHPQGHHGHGGHP